MWPVSILPQAGGEEGGKSEGSRQPRMLTLTERHCLAQKVKGVYFPSSTGSSCPIKSNRGAGPTSQSHPLVPSSLGLHPDSPAPLCAFTDDFHTAWCALPSPSPVHQVPGIHPSGLSLNMSSSWKPPLVGSSCNAARGSVCSPHKPRSHWVTTNCLWPSLRVRGSLCIVHR